MRSHPRRCRLADPSLGSLKDVWGCRYTYPCSSDGSGSHVTRLEEDNPCATLTVHCFLVLLVWLAPRTHTSGDSYRSPKVPGRRHRPKNPTEHGCSHAAGPTRCRTPQKVGGVEAERSNSSWDRPWKERWRNRCLREAFPRQTAARKSSPPPSNEAVVTRRLGAHVATRSRVNDPGGRPARVEFKTVFVPSRLGRTPAAR